MMDDDDDDDGLLRVAGVFDIDEVRTFLMTTISSKGEDERALINRGTSALFFSLFIRN
jgi:hypothetical protein